MQYGGACRCSDSYGSKGEDADGCTMDCLQGSDYNQLNFSNELIKNMVAFRYGGPKFPFVILKIFV